MRNTRGELNKLVMVVVLIIALLFVLFVCITKGKNNRETVLKTEMIKERVLLERKSTLPQLKDVVDEYKPENLTAQEADTEILPETKIKDLALESILTEKTSLPEGDLQEQEDALETVPSPEEMEALKRRGLIIY